LTKPENTKVIPKSNLETNARILCPFFIFYLS
jgi:hypothetical protein